MSLLLEALKKAALEKQSKAENDSVTPAAQLEPSLADTLEQRDEVEPVAFEETPEQTTIEDVDVFPDFDIEIVDDEPNEADTEENTFDSQDTLEPAEDFEPEAIDDDIENDELVFEPEFESVTEEETEEKRETSDDDLIDQAEIEAARKRLEEEQALEEQRRQEEQAKIKREEEEKRLAEQERQRQKELEQKRKEEAENNERKRQAAKSREALDQLIVSGKNIQQQAKRRSAFLYLLLMLTAVGGLFAYYIFLSASTGREELRSNIVSEPNQDIVEVAEMLQADEPVTPEPAIDNNQVLTSSNSVMLTDAGESSVLSSPTSAAPASVSTTLTSSVSDPEAEQQTTTARGTIGETSPAIQSGIESTIARRVDPAPSASEYLQPLILSAGGNPQSAVSERVIIHHEAKPAEISDVIAKGYQALQANRAMEADRLYRAALNIDPSQRDALLGAAAAATALGNYNDATKFYRQRLEIEPGDTYARAGLLSLASDSSSRVSVMGEIDAMLRDHPESAQLHFLKGVGFASANEWQSAQDAFYEAYRRETESPDYAFNLAVSLDHLNQPALARVYYERALDLSERRKFTFDQSATRQRVTELDAP